VVLVVALISCGQPGTFESAALAELACSANVEQVTWDTVVDGVSLAERRREILGRQEFVNNRSDELFERVGVLLSASDDRPVTITWEGEDCPAAEFRVPVDGTWIVDGVAPSADCVCVLDQDQHLECVGGIDHDVELETRIRALLPDGAGLVVQPPLLLWWDTKSSAATAEVWVEFLAAGRDAATGSDIQSVVVEMHDLEYQVPDG
jgi:hypothetical protein